MHICLKNIRARFHPDLILTLKFGALDFFEECPPQEEDDDDEYLI